MTRVKDTHLAGFMPLLVMISAVAYDVGAGAWDLLLNMPEERDKCDGKVQTKCGRMLAAGVATSAGLGVNCRRRLIMGSGYLSIHSTRHRLIEASISNHATIDSCCWASDFGHHFSFSIDELRLRKSAVAGG